MPPPAAAPFRPTSRLPASGLDELNGEQAGIRASLASRRAVLAEVLGSLLRMGAHPPPAILVKPQDALSAVRSAIALGAVVPEMRAETEVLATELAELARIGKDIDIERSSLSVALARQAEDEERMALILEEKKKLTNEARQELAQQGSKAAELAARETDLSKLIGRIENEITAVREAALAAKKAEDERAAREQEMLKNARAVPPADFSDTGRIAPAMAFEKAVGLLPKPVEGVEVNAFGKVDALGKPSPGRFDRNQRQCPRRISGRWLGCLCRSVPFLRTTIDPERRQRLSCGIGWNGTH